jgi:hypothetical protein
VFGCNAITTGYRNFAGHFALGKGFAEFCTRQRLHGKIFVGKDLFAECQYSAKKSCHDSAV